MGNDDVAKLARGYAIEFCREHGVDEQDADDYIQEGVMAALTACAGKQETGRAFIRTRARGAIMNYHKRWANGGIGGRDAPAPEMVYLSDTAPGVVDAAGEDIETTYGDMLSYDDAPTGFADPETEADAGGAKTRVLEVLHELEPRDREVLGLLYLRDMTQREVAETLGISQQAVGMREKAALARMKILFENTL